jgi:hypothetical protein
MWSMKIAKIFPTQNGWAKFNVNVADFESTGCTLHPATDLRRWRRI